MVSQPAGEPQQPQTWGKSLNPAEPRFPPLLSGESQLHESDTKATTVVTATVDLPPSPRPAVDLALHTISPASVTIREAGAACLSSEGCENQRLSSSRFKVIRLTGGEENDSSGLLRSLAPKCVLFKQLRLEGSGSGGGRRGEAEAGAGGRAGAEGLEGTRLGCRLHV